MEAEKENEPNDEKDVKDSQESGIPTKPKRERGSFPTTNANSNKRALVETWNGPMDVKKKKSRVSPTSSPTLLPVPTSVDAQNPLELLISGLVDSTGAISDVNKMPKFMELVRKAHAHDQRSILVAALCKITSIPCLLKFIENNGLTNLYTWLSDKRCELSLKNLILQLLPNLPVNKENLLSSKIWDVVREIVGQKDCPQPLRGMAKLLHAKWEQKFNEDDGKDQAESSENSSGKLAKRELDVPDAEGQPTKKKLKTKSVTWAANNVLVNVHVYSQDDPVAPIAKDSVEKKGSVALAAAAVTVAMAKKKNLPKEMRPTIVWQLPPEIDVSGFEILKTEHGKDSKERAVQTTRDRSVTPAIYLKPSSIPLSPAEPEAQAEHDEKNVPVIPLEAEVDIDQPTIIESPPRSTPKNLIPNISPPSNTLPPITNPTLTKPKEPSPSVPTGGLPLELLLKNQNPPIVPSMISINKTQINHPSVPVALPLPLSLPPRPLPTTPPLPTTFPTSIPHPFSSQPPLSSSFSSTPSPHSLHSDPSRSFHLGPSVSYPSQTQPPHLAHSQSLQPSLLPSHSPIPNHMSPSRLRFPDGTDDRRSWKSSRLERSRPRSRSRSRSRSRKFPSRLSRPRSRRGSRGGGPPHDGRPQSHPLPLSLEG